MQHVWRMRGTSTCSASLPTDAASRPSAAATPRGRQTSVGTEIDLVKKERLGERKGKDRWRNVRLLLFGELGQHLQNIPSFRGETQEKNITHKYHIIT